MVGRGLGEGAAVVLVGLAVPAAPRCADGLVVVGMAETFATGARVCPGPGRGAVVGVLVTVFIIGLHTWPSPTKPRLQTHLRSTHDACSEHLVLAQPPYRHVAGVWFVTLGSKFTWVVVSAGVARRTLTSKNCIRVWIASS